MADLILRMKSHYTKNKVGFQMAALTCGKGIFLAKQKTHLYNNRCIQGNKTQS